MSSCAYMYVLIPIVTGPVHRKPLSVDETKFEALCSSSSQSTIPFSSDAVMCCTMKFISYVNPQYMSSRSSVKIESFSASVSPCSFSINSSRSSKEEALEKMNFQEEGLRQNGVFHWDLGI
ncbi:hypothetical protein RIF29_10470 [Crotalaria pallida]|uniref:Uncharacterized protein n=1 Tax=Crotalaria pallida TaxID=3830 RepID=A0AAN9IK25_CROPI